MSKVVRFNNEATAKFRGIADAIHENSEVTGNVMSEKESGAAFKQVLAESDLGLTMAQIEGFKKLEADYLKGQELAAMEAGATCFENDIKEEKFNAKTSVPGGKIQTTVYRSKTYSNNFAKEGESKEITKNLVVASKVDTVSTRGISSIREAVAKEYEEKFLK